MYVGDECAPLQQGLECSPPVVDGAVRDWRGMELCWDRAFRHVLRAHPPECRALLTEAPLAPAAQRRRTVEVMLETFGFQGVAVQVQAVLSLYSQGLLSGMVVDAGDGATHAVRTRWVLLLAGCSASARRRLQTALYPAAAGRSRLSGRAAHPLTHAHKHTVAQMPACTLFDRCRS